MTAADTAIDAAGVGKRFAAGGRETTALAEATFRVGAGRVTGLIGPDGAGKTTFMRLAAGLLAPDAGRIEVLGLDATRDALAVQAQIGYMPQRMGLYEDLSVQETVDLYADLQGVPAAERPERYRELMQMTGLGEFTARLAGRLSGGMKQKLGLACTLVRSPQLLLLDEPTVGVDPVSRRELWAIVYRLVRDEGMSVLLSTAYLDEAERCDDVVLLHEGRVLEQGGPGTMSARVEGRTFTATAPGMRSRELQATLAGRSGVVDAVVQGDRVRIVARESADPAALADEVEGLHLTPVPPRFEDSFVARLQGEAGTATSLDLPSPPRPAGGEDEIVIRVEGLSRRFGDFYAVNDVSFDVRRGEVFGLLGANGAGKSTTFRMLCGLLPASQGSLRVAGVDLRTAAAAARERIGYMSQKFSLYGNLTVRQNLDFFTGAYGLKGRERDERIAWALDEFELEAHADDASADLPLGYKQRLAMACALMHAPDILFLDEPTSGVDPLARREFWGRINALARAGVTVMVTTHFMEEAEYCDRLAIMAAGRILAIGEPAAIKARARTPDAPEPSMEDAFIRLIQNGDDGRGAGT
ncbi:MAG TPA: ATP-binding cassette domain-containing protein [Pelomicrobium sp.]|nr:ATP-binding cassette domain-containing protein [Pelomicrobium sp.]